MGAHWHMCHHVGPRPPFLCTCVLPVANVSRLPQSLSWQCHIFPPPLPYVPSSANSWRVSVFATLVFLVHTVTDEVFKQTCPIEMNFSGSQHKNYSVGRHVTNHSTQTRTQVPTTMAFNMAWSAWFQFRNCQAKAQSITSRHQNDVEHRFTSVLCVLYASCVCMLCDACARCPVLC